VTEATWSWREVPVLEAVLRLGRLGETATPASIADEAILHADDVSASISRLVDAGYLDVLDVDTGEHPRTTIVTPSNAFRALVRSARPPANGAPTAPAELSSTAES
jgi:DNA-binding MarR family transcriptional regulator